MSDTVPPAKSLAELQAELEAQQAAARQRVEEMLYETLKALGEVTHDDASRAKVKAAIDNAIANLQGQLQANVQARNPGLAGFLVDNGVFENPMLRQQLIDAIEGAQTFYTDHQGRRHRITEMANGHLHNAVEKLKRERRGGIMVFTVLAMDAEIKRRDAARENEHG